MIFYTIKSVSFPSEQKDDKVVCVKLCNVKPQNNKETLPPKITETLTTKKITPPIKKIEKVKEIKPVISPKKTYVEVEKKVEVVKEKKEVLAPIEDKKEEPKIEQKVVEPPALVLSENKDTSSCNCGENCNCDSKKETQEMKSQKAQQEYMDENMKKIVMLLQENLYYPRVARERGITGEIVVRFSLDTNAKVKFVEVVSSKSDLLSRAAVKTIEDLSGDFPKPKENLVLKLPINYNLK